jgi:DNA-binding IclR family transcriptional regulator
LVKQIRLTPQTSKTITDEAAFGTEIARIRTRGYALDDEENEVGGRCVAAPVLDHRGKPVAAVSISAPVQRFPMEQVPEYGNHVQDAARAISKRLGYLEPS